MKSFDIDFVRRPLPRWATAGFLAVSAVVFIASLNHFNDRRNEARTLAAERRKAIEDSMRPQPPSAETVRNEEQRALERAALVYPWKSVFDAVEAAAGPDVKLVSFSHDRAGRRSHAVLEGSNFAALDAALTRMKRSSPPSTEWTVESLSREQGEGTGSYRATVLGRW